MGKLLGSVDPDDGRILVRRKDNRRPVGYYDEAYAREVCALLVRMGYGPQDCAVCNGDGLVRVGQDEVQGYASECPECDGWGSPQVKDAEVET